MRSKKYCLLFTVHRLLLYILLFTVFTACGRRDDPVITEPYKEIGVVKNLKGDRKEDGIYLTWGIPKDKGFPKKAIKGFIIMRAEVPVGSDSFREGVTVEECRCEYIPVDFIVPEWDKGDLFTYLDKKTIEGRTYAYKIVVKDKNNRMGKDSNIAIVGKKQEPEK